MLSQSWISRSSEVGSGPRRPREADLSESRAEKGLAAGDDEQTSAVSTAGRVQRGLVVSGERGATVCMQSVYRDGRRIGQRVRWSCSRPNAFWASGVEGRLAALSLAVT